MSSYEGLCPDCQQIECDEACMKMTSNVKLLPCPFCGEGKHLLVEHLEGTILHPAYRIRCDNCGASTGYTDRDFRANWNTRANVAHATAAKDAEIEALRAEVERLRNALMEVDKGLDAVECESHADALAVSRCSDTIHAALQERGE